MAHDPETTSRLAGLNPVLAGQLLLGTADLILVMDSDRRIHEVQVGWGLDFPGIAALAGRLVDEVLCQASRAKLPLLLADNGAEAAEPPRWRHVNLQTPSGSLPVLMRYFGFPGAAGGVHLLVARDLRPVAAMQAQVQRTMTDLERRAEAREAQRQRATDPLRQVGRQPLDGIVREAAQALERLCAQEALAQAAGDRARAAAILGIGTEAFDRLLAGKG